MIYFLRCEQDSGAIKLGLIKIGTTIRLSVRLKQIADEIGHTPTVLAILDGGYSEERALHLRFSMTRRVGEWFDPCPDLLSIIEVDGRPWDKADEIELSVVKLNREVATDAKIVAIKMGVTLSEYMTESMRPIVRKDYDKLVRKGGEKGS